LELLGKLQLDPARRALISDFVDAYLRLTIQEQSVFEDELKKIEPERQERVMEIVTSWMEQGVKRGKSDLVLRMLRKRFGSLDAESEGRVGQLSVEQLEELAEALLDFSAPSDLATWLDAKSV
jgi:DNA repair photolyase